MTRPLRLQGLKKRSSIEKHAIKKDKRPMSIPREDPVTETTDVITGLPLIQAGMRLRKEGCNLKLVALVVTRNLVLCSDNDDSYAVFRRQGISIVPGKKRDDAYSMDDVTQAGRLVHYILSGGKVGGEPSTVDDCSQALSHYARCYRKHRNSEMSELMGQVDQSLYDFRLIIKECDSIDEVHETHIGRDGEWVKSKYQDWWMAAVIEQYEGIDNPIGDGEAEWCNDEYCYSSDSCDESE
jgi:hypothetical protein